MTFNRDKAIGAACVMISFVMVCVVLAALAGCGKHHTQARFVVDASKCWSDGRIVSAPEGGCAPPLEPYVWVIP